MLNSPVISALSSKKQKTVSRAQQEEPTINSPVISAPSSKKQKTVSRAQQEEPTIMWVLVLIAIFCNWKKHFSWDYLLHLSCLILQVEDSR